jgi:hypothetical protein
MPNGIHRGEVRRKPFAMSYLGGEDPEPRALREERLFADFSAECREIDTKITIGADKKKR